jgi:ribose transport system permease protein
VSVDGAVPARSRVRDFLRPGLRTAALRDYGIVAAFVILFVVLALSSDVFLSLTNWLNILDQWSAVAIMGCGWTLALIAGGFDLSIGAVYALSSVVAAEVAVSTGSAGLGLLVGPLAGLGIGVLNGGLSTVGRINSFMATLSMSFVVRGVALAISGGYLIRVVTEEGRPTNFNVIGRSEFLGAKYSVWLLAGVILVTGFLLHRTIFGRHLYAAGGNAEAARLSGVRVDLVRWITFVISGLCAGIGGMIVASRVATGQSDVGVGIEFDVIAAVAVGGTSIFGGSGAIWRTIIGVLLLAMIQNGFNLLNVSAVYQRIVFGLIILAAVGIDAWSRRAST